MTKTEGHTPPFRGHSWTHPQAPVPHSPLHRLPVREKRAEAGDALESQGAEAPVVHGHRVLLLLQELWGLWENKCWGSTEGLLLLGGLCRRGNLSFSSRPPLPLTPSREHWCVHLRGEEVTTRVAGGIYKFSVPHSLLMLIRGPPGVFLGRPEHSIHPFLGCHVQVGR